MDDLHLKTFVNSPGVSIIIPCYNIAPYIAQCIDSVLAQTYADFELLLLNDGSSDGTLQICEQFAAKDNRITVYTHANRGVSYTRNRGIREAKGDFVMFIDGDDNVESDYIESHVVNLEKDCITISGFLNEINGVVTKNVNYKKILSDSNFKRISKNQFLSLIKYNVLSTPCCKIYDLKGMQQNKLFFEENVTYQEDLLFNVQYFSHYSRYKLINYFGYHYVARDNSSTSRYHKNFDHTNAVFKGLQPFVRDEEDDVIFKEYILQTILRKISNIFHHNNLDNIFQKNKKVDEVLNSEEFNYSKDFIEKLDLNLILKKLVQLESSYLFSFYFYLRKFLVK